MTRSVRARFAALGVTLASTLLVTQVARADVFLYNGEIFFCTTTCNSFAALGGATGGSNNTINSVVEGFIDIPVQPDGSFSFGEMPPGGTPGTNCTFVPTTADIPFSFTITNSGAAPCPDPADPGLACTGNTLNPLVLDDPTATLFGSGTVDADGNLETGTITFTFTEPPFCNNNGQVEFDLTDSTATGTVFDGLIPFTNIAGAGDPAGFSPAPPVLAVSLPDPDPFPATPIGMTSTATVTVTNTGQGQGVVTLNTASLMAPFSIQSETCTAAPLAPTTGSCTIDVAFSPTAEGMNLTGMFSVESANNDPASILVTVSGDATAPEINVDPMAVTFADVAIGNSASLDVTVTNSGTAALNIPAMGVTMPDAPFALAADTCSGMAIAVDGTCTITVSFTPDTPGDASSSFDIASDDPNEATVTVNLTGAASAPNITVMPQPLVFASVLTNQTATLGVTVSNTGSADLDIGMIDGSVIVAPFSLMGDTCSSMTLAPAATCTLTFEFAPTVAGDFTNDYTIASNDPDTPSFAGSIEGQATQAPEPFITVDPMALPLGEVIVSQMSMNTVTITNDGSADLTIGNVSIAGANAMEFAQTNDCNAPLMPMASCTVTVTFTPSDVGDRMATLTIESDGANEMASDVALSGVGVLGPQLTLSVAELALGSSEEPVELDDSTTATLMAISAGSLPVSVSGVALSGDGVAEFAVSMDECTQATLMPMETCNLEITFAPTTAGDKTATLTVTSDDVDMPEQTVALTGFVLVGSRPEFSVPEIAIGESTNPVTVGDSGTSMFDITNTGTDPLLVVSVALGGADADQFAVTEDCTAAPVDRNNSCMINVTFTPNSAGEKSAELTIVTESAVTRFTRGTAQTTTVIPIMAIAAEPPPPPPPPPGSQTNIPPSFAVQDEGSSGACFIATAAYGSYLDPNVQVLRDFRDRVLMTNDLGRKFVRLYYSHSPGVADHISHNESARLATRLALTPVVYALAYPVPALMLLAAAWYGLRRRRALVLRSAPS